jgi:hypothetical protein
MAIFINGVNIADVAAYPADSSEFPYFKGIVTLKNNTEEITPGNFVVGRKYMVDFVAVGSTLFTEIGASKNADGVEFTATGTGSGISTSSHGLELEERLINSPATFYTIHGTGVEVNRGQEGDDTVEVNMPIFIGGTAESNRVRYVSPNTIIKPILRYSIIASIPNSAFIAFSSATITGLKKNTSDPNDQRCVVNMIGGGGGGGGGKTSATAIRDGGGGGSGAIVIWRDLLLPNNSSYSLEILSGGSGGSGAASPTDGSNGQTARINFNGNIVAAQGGFGGKSELVTGDGGEGGDYFTSGTLPAGSGNRAVSRDGYRGGNYGQNGQAYTKPQLSGTPSFGAVYFGVSRFRSPVSASSFYNDAFDTTRLGGAGASNGGGGGASSAYSFGGAGGSGTDGGAGGIGAGGGGGDSRGSSSGGGTAGGNGGRARVLLYF